MNSIPHLVARALRTHRTVTWRYLNDGGGYWGFHGFTRSQILKAVRRAPVGLDYGLEYAPSLDRSKLPNPSAYGLNAYAYPEQTQPAPSAVPYNEQIRNLVALRLQNEAELLRSLGNIFDTAQADKLQEISAFLSRSTEK